MKDKTPPPTVTSREAAGPRVIRRYPNRKLYDTHHSAYITQKEIALLVAQGHEIRIVDSKTQADLTSEILAQILLRKQKPSKANLPLETLRELLQNKGESLSKRFGEQVRSFQREAERNMRKMLSPLHLTPPPSEQPEPLEQGESAPPETQEPDPHQDETWLPLRAAIAPWDFLKRIRELEQRVRELELELQALRETKTDG